MYSYLLVQASTACSHCTRARAYYVELVKNKNLNNDVCRGMSASASEHRGIRGNLDQLSYELKHYRDAMQKREIEVSKWELGRYVCA